ncbi:MAG: endonuclease III domain-containing protein [Candidatus Micrarchaeota archaeon]|nr:endonuclease III domain-containing protein [Candidatus Micrarchaeota archaeon]
MGSLPMLGLYEELRKNFGYRHWWPGETEDEITIGAILTQQVSWTNVEKAIKNLKENDMLSLAAIADANLPELERLVRPTGFFRQKARRLRNFAQYVARTHGSLGIMFRKDSAGLRKELLDIDGVGPETADSIMLYAAGKRIFVIDAYTRRIMSRMYGTPDDMGYDELQEYISSRIPGSTKLYNDFHAQFVELGKNYCRTKPLCDMCPVKRHCSYYKAQMQG